MQQQTEPLQVDPKTAAAMLTISRRTLYTITEQRQLPVVRIGRIVRYRVADLQAYIDRLAEASIAEQPAA